MSPQSKGRKRKNAKRGRSEPRGPEMLVARMVQGALRDLATATDALDAELRVSELLGAWWGEHHGDVDPEVELGERLVAYAARKRQPAAVALLRAVAVLGTERQREQAAAAAEALVAHGVDEPAWARAFGTDRVTGTWAYGDVYGDRTNVLLVLERGGSRHGVVVQVDHTLGGTVADAFLTEEPDGVLEDVRELDDDPLGYVREMPPAEAGALLVPAVAATDAAARAGEVPEVSEEFPPVRALVAARVRLLPGPAAPAPGPALPDAAARTAVLAEFLSSVDARDLPPGARGCAELLLDFGCATDPAHPLRVGPALVDRFLDITVNELELSGDELAALPATVRAWTAWAGRRADLSEPAMRELREAVDDMACAIGRPGDPEPVPSDVADAYLAGLDLETLAPEDLPDLLERRMFAVPHVGTRIGDEEFPFLDPSDPDDRGMLIEGEHPEYHDALADPDSETVDGVNPRLHVTVHEIVANQLWDDDPPQVWQAARRLLATGAERHDVLHAIGEVLITHLHGLLTGQGDGDIGRYVAELEQLGRAGRGGGAVVTPLRPRR